MQLEELNELFGKLNSTDKESVIKLFKEGCEKPNKEVLKVIFELIENEIITGIKRKDLTDLQEYRTYIETHCPYLKLLKIFDYDFNENKKKSVRRTFNLACYKKRIDLVEAIISLVKTKIINKISVNDLIVTKIALKFAHQKNEQISPFQTLCSFKSDKAYQYKLYNVLFDTMDNSQKIDFLKRDNYFYLNLLAQNEIFSAVEFFIENSNDESIRDFIITSLKNTSENSKDKPNILPIIAQNFNLQNIKILNKCLEVIPEEFQKDLYKIIIDIPELNYQSYRKYINILHELRTEIRDPIQKEEFSKYIDKLFNSLYNKYKSNLSDLEKDKLLQYNLLLSVVQIFHIPNEQRKNKANEIIDLFNNLNLKNKFTFFNLISDLKLFNKDATNYLFGKNLVNEFLDNSDFFNDNSDRSGNILKILNDDDLKTYKAMWKSKIDKIISSNFNQNNSFYSVCTYFSLISKLADGENIRKSIIEQIIANPVALQNLLCNNNPDEVLYQLRGFEEQIKLKLELEGYSYIKNLISTSKIGHLQIEILLSNKLTRNSTIKIIEESHNQIYSAFSDLTIPEINITKDTPLDKLDFYKYIMSKASYYTLSGINFLERWIELSLKVNIQTFYKNLFVPNDSVNKHNLFRTVNKYSIKGILLFLQYVKLEDLPNQVYNLQKEISIPKELNYIYNYEEKENFLSYRDIYSTEQIVLFIVLSRELSNLGWKTSRISNLKKSLSNTNFKNLMEANSNILEAFRHVTKLDDISYRIIHGLVEDSFVEENIIMDKNLAIKVKISSLKQAKNNVSTGKKLNKLEIQINFLKILLEEVLVQKDIPCEEAKEYVENLINKVNKLTLIITKDNILDNEKSFRYKALKEGRLIPEIKELESECSGTAESPIANHLNKIKQIIAEGKKTVKSYIALEEQNKSDFTQVKKKAKYKITFIDT